MIRFILCGALAVLCLAPVVALDVGEALPDPALEARARALSQELRCLVCQNQSIDDSDAALARDLRNFVRTRLQAGDSDTAIRTLLREKYGDFILFRPPFAPHTYLLWFAPLLLLVFGVYVVFKNRGRA